MPSIKSKNADLVLGKNQVLDLYDEQIDANKELSLSNQELLQNLLGRVMTLENYANDFENRISNLENQ